MVNSDFEGSSLLAGLPPGDLRRDRPTARIVPVRHRGTIYALAVTILVARILQSQSLVHVCFVHTNAVASWRFGFFFVQFICFFWLIGIVVGG